MPEIEAFPISVPESDLADLKGRIERARLPEPETDNPVVTRLVDALNRHDVEAVVSCFAPDFTNEWPAHPSRAFEGTEPVRRNWQAIFTRFPRIRVSVTASVEVGDDVWGEWVYVRDEGDELRGVIIITVRDEKIRRARFYMEEVDSGGAVDPGGPRRMTS